MSTKDTLLYIPEKVAVRDIYPKVAELIDHIVSNFETKLEDVRLKHLGPSVVSNDVVKEIIFELGFGYIKDIMDTITDLEFNTLLDFLTLINLLKGHRDGLNLVLRFLGFESSIIEWWQQDPLGPEHTFLLSIVIDSSHVEDLDNTIEKVKIFTRNYVYPILDEVNFLFTFDSLFEANLIMAGFVKMKETGTIRQRA